MSVKISINYQDRVLEANQADVHTQNHVKLAMPETPEYPEIKQTTAGTKNRGGINQGQQVGEASKFSEHEEKNYNRINNLKSNDTSSNETTAVVSKDMTGELDSQEDAQTLRSTDSGATTASPLYMAVAAALENHMLSPTASTNLSNQLAPGAEGAFYTPPTLPNSPTTEHTGAVTAKIADFLEGSHEINKPGISAEGGQLGSFSEHATLSTHTPLNAHLASPNEVVIVFSSNEFNGYLADFYGAETAEEIRKYFEENIDKQGEEFIEKNQGFSQNDFSNQNPYNNAPGYNNNGNRFEPNLNNPFNDDDNTTTNSAPNISISPQEISEDQNTLSGQLSLSDPDGDSVTVALSNNNSNIGNYGTLTLNSNGTFSYNLDNASQTVQALGPSETLTDIFLITATDTSGNTTSQNLTITIIGTNDAPIAQATINSIAEDSSSDITGQLAATDADTNDSLTFTTDDTATYGTLTLNTDGSYNYAINNNNSTVQALGVGESVIDTIYYTVSDAHGGSDIQTLKVTITGTNDIPMAEAATNSIAEDATSISGQLTATDVDVNDNLTFTANESAHYGTLTLNTDGSYSYNIDNANANIQALGIGETLTDAIHYTVSDNHGGSDNFGMLTITITGTDDVPVAQAATNSIAEDATSISGQLSATDVDTNDTLTFSTNETAAYGSLSLSSNGSYSYYVDNELSSVQALGVGETLTDTINYTVSDGQGGSDTKALTITITGTNDAPVAQAASNDINEDATSVSGQLAATDADTSDSLTFSTNSPAAGQTYGTFNLNADGSYSYVATYFDDPTKNLMIQDLSAGMSLNDTFSYTVTDSSGASSTETLIITIHGANDSLTQVHGDDTVNTLTLTNGNEEVWGYAGNDTISTTTGGNTIHAGAGDDSVTSGSSNDTLYGDAGNDTLTGGYGSDVLSGGAGNDIIYGDHQTFTNSSIAGMQLWLDASDVNGDGTAVASGTNIATWTDKSGQGNNATAPGNDPMFTYDSDGFATIQFDNTNSEYMSADSAANVAQSSHTFAFVTDIISLNAAYTALAGFHTSGYNNAEIIFLDTTANGGANGLTYTDAAGDHSITADRDYVTTGKFAFIGTMDTDVNTFTTYVDGVLKNAIASTANSDASTFSINMDYDPGPALGDFSNANFYELMLFDSVLSTTDRSTLGEYFGQKYGLTYNGGSLGADVLAGGLGADTFMFTNASDSGTTDASRDVITDFNTGSGTYNASEGDIIDISTLQNTPYNISGISGFSGVANDLIWQQGTGSDAAHTFISLDTDGDSNADWQIKLENFDADNLSLADFNFGANSSPTQTGSTGNDTLTGSNKIDIIYGGDGNDSLTGGNNADYLSGDAGDDSLAGGYGNDMLFGGDGNDTLVGGYGGDTLLGGAGDDIIYFDNQAFNNSIISGMKLWLDASDVNADGSAITDGTAISTWSDKSGLNNDAIAVDTAAYTQNTTSLGNQAALAFDGNDYYTLPDGTVPTGNNSYSIFSVALTNGNNVNGGIVGSGNYWSSNQVNALRMSGNTNIQNYWWDNDLITSTNPITVNEGFIANINYDNTVGRSLSVNGSVEATNSATNLNNGSTNNTIGKTFGTEYFTGNIAEVLIYQGALTDAQISLINEYLSYKYDIAINGSSFGADVATGGLGADTFMFTNASHSGTTDASRDVITDFNTGAGTYNASEGDIIDISTLQSTPYHVSGLAGFTGTANEITWEQGTGNDAAHTFISLDTDGDSTADWQIKLENFDADNLSLTDFNFGANSSATQTGSTGNDTITGSDKVDIIYGGDGNDSLTGGDNADYLSGDAGDDTLHGGLSADYLYGGDGNDVIYGEAGADFLYGEAGNDTLQGGAGNDIAQGGAGNDVYIFNLGDGTDTFSGGTAGGWTDAIQLDASTDASNPVSNAADIVGAGGWALSADQAYTITDNGDSTKTLTFNAEASGTIELSDGSVLNFSGTESIDF